MACTYDPNAGEVINVSALAIRLDLPADKLGCS